MNHYGANITWYFAELETLNNYNSAAAAATTRHEVHDSLKISLWDSLTCQKYFITLPDNGGGGEGMLINSIQIYLNNSLSVRQQGRRQSRIFVMKYLSYFGIWSLQYFLTEYYSFREAGDRWDRRDSETHREGYILILIVSLSLSLFLSPGLWSVLLDIISLPNTPPRSNKKLRNLF